MTTVNDTFENNMNDLKEISKKDNKKIYNFKIAWSFDGNEWNRILIYPTETVLNYSLRENNGK